MADLKFIQGKDGLDLSLDYFEFEAFPKGHDLVSFVDLFGPLETGVAIAEPQNVQIYKLRDYVNDAFQLTEKMKLKSWKNSIYHNSDFQVTLVWDHKNYLKVQTKSKTRENWIRILAMIRFLKENSIGYGLRRLDVARHSSNPLILPFMKLCLNEGYWVSKSGDSSKFVPAIINRHSKGQGTSAYFYGSSFTVANYDRRAKIDSLRRRLETDRLKDPVRIGQIKSTIETFEAEWEHVANDVPLNRFEWRIRDKRGLNPYLKILNESLLLNEDSEIIYRDFCRLASLQFLKSHPIQNAKRQKCDVWSSYFETK
jgi:hypothetical protein